MFESLPMLHDPWFYTLAIPAVLVVGMSKGGFGPGTGLLALPLLSLTIPPLQAAAITLPLLCAMDLAGLWSYRKHWDRANMAIILPGALVGIVIGALTADWVSNQGVQIIVGVVAVVFVLHKWLGRNSTEPMPRHLGRGLFWSCISGFTSFVAHAGSPPLSVYLLPQQINKTMFVGTSLVYFAVLNYVKLVPYAWLGQLSAVNLGTALVLMPVAVTGVYLGIWLHKYIDDKLFYRIAYGLTLLCGLKLLADGFGF
ncbi:sulfite exporter TauE/SafE family protein [Ferrovibrio sp.]|uniref:sulfite exporter TauE/SafE family protein n=1 Tax=Ferrovibrio sp. TaxID=1917215 RepID=UPI0025BB5861|nr:sulfite exporter TauE/SafE family protein [Ferrovibrio sp.]